jgi:hypothetical protein
MPLPLRQNLVAIEIAIEIVIVIVIVIGGAKAMAGWE